MLKQFETLSGKYPIITSTVFKTLKLEKTYLCCIYTSNVNFLRSLFQNIICQNELYTPQPVNLHFFIKSTSNNFKGCLQK